MASAATLLVLLAAGRASAAPAPRVGAGGAVLWDPVDDVALFGRQENKGRPMASTTKIMTALLVYEAGRAEGSLLVSPNAASVGARAGAATVGLQAGQRVPVRTVLAGLLLESGNDAAIALAEHVAGSEAAFVARMNERAAALGLADTNFEDPSGLSDDLGHRSAPVDLARLAEVAMRDSRFAELAGTPSLETSALGTLSNRNLLLGGFTGATGVKTGFTLLAGNCLVASAERGGRTLFAVVLASPDSFAESAILLEYGFTNFRRAQPLRAGVATVPYRWADAAVPAIAPEGLAATVATDRPATWRTLWSANVARPAPAGAPLGQAELRVDGQVTRTVPLVAAEPVPPLASAPPVAEAGGAVVNAVRAFVRAVPADRAA